MISFEREIVSLEQLVEKLSVVQQEYQDFGVLVRGDAEGPFQNVANVLNACRTAGVSEMGISVRLDKRRF